MSGADDVSAPPLTAGVAASFEKGDLSLAEKQQREYMKYLDEQAATSEQKSSALLVLTKILYAEKHFAEAEKACKESIQLSNRNEVIQNWQLLRILNAEGRADQTEALARKLLENDAKLDQSIPKHCHIVAVDLEQLVTALLAQKRFIEARRLAERALRTFRKAKCSTIELTFALRQLALADEGLGRKDEAAKLRKEADALQSSTNRN